MTTATIEKPEIEVGWHHGLSMEEYLAIDAMSASRLEVFRRSPKHYRKELRTQRDSTPAMDLGTALHMALLEPLLFEGHYVVLGQCEATRKGDGERCTNPGTKYRDGQSFCGVTGHDPYGDDPENPEIHVLGEQAMADLEGMRDAIREHPRASTLFEGRGDYELTGIWRDEATGVLCKMRIDRDIPRSSLLADLKTTRDASKHGFRREIENRGYHRKAAFYRRGCAALGRERHASAFVAVENSDPYGVLVHLMDEDQLATVDRGITRKLNHFAMCQKHGHWPGYGDEMTITKVRPWALDEEEQDSE